MEIKYSSDYRIGRQGNLIDGHKFAIRELVRVVNLRPRKTKCFFYNAPFSIEQNLENRQKVGLFFEIQ